MTQIEPQTDTMPEVLPRPTPLAAALHHQPAQLALHSGAFTTRTFEGLPIELDSLLHAAGVSDLGWRGKILVTGTDRLRWLNGMVSNTVQSLPEGQGNYSFLLSVQGRIQGDCLVYRRPGDLLLDTGCDQLPTLLRHLEHFVIMDDVELADVSRSFASLALTGPAAGQVLATLGCTPPNTGLANAVMHSTRIGEVPCTLIELPPSLVPHYELWFAPEHLLPLWETLQAAGATPCGLEAVEALRVLEAIPLYGVDLNERDLPQETAQMRALSFSKGCYLGQEIVERIRSRGKVHRQFRQFALRGDRPAGLPAELNSGGQPVGKLTSFADLSSAGAPEPLAIGFIRAEVLERDQPVTYDGGVATALALPPQLARPPALSAH